MRKTVKNCWLNRPRLRKPRPATEPRLEGVFAEKGARFHGKWGLGAPSPPPPFPNSPYTPWPPRPPPPGFSVKPPPPPRGRGVGGGGRRGPIYRENEPLFRRKRLRDGPTRNFHEKYREKIPVFLGYFGAKIWESRISGRGVFFRYFSVKFRVGPFRGSVAGRGVLKSKSTS